MEMNLHDWINKTKVSMDKIEKMQMKMEEKDSS